MTEYDLYLPLHYNDGRRIPSHKLDRFKKMLLDEFGGLTHFPQENEGSWNIGGVTFRDHVAILRVISSETEHARKFFAELRIELMRALEQADVLIVERQIALVR